MDILADNKKAFFDYEILETFEAGLMLTGAEVKATRGGGMNLKGAYVTFAGKGAFLLNAHIRAYEPAGPNKNYEPTRSRRLLLHQKELGYLRGKALEKGLTIMPLKVYTKNHFIKIQIAVARGRHAYDKREAIKKRELQREIKKWE